MTDKEIYYEMLWNCTTCSTKGLLGETHRHCPACGAAQDPARRYFPQPGDEVEASNHQFVGADWSCAYCNSPNSAACAHCTNCGAGKDGTKPVATIQDPAAVPDVQQALPPSRGISWWKWLLGLVALAVVVLGALFSVTKEATVTVSQKTWSREIQIDHLARVSDSAWCDSVPADAYGITRTREQRSSRKVEDGKDCHEERVDKGDGTFVKRKECVPRYREEPVLDDRCHFQVNRWRASRSVKAASENSALPVWPSVASLQSNFNVLGSEREGARTEHYVLELTSGGKHWTCSVAENVWNRYTQGMSTPVKIRLVGGADCSSLH